MNRRQLLKWSGAGAGALALAGLAGCATSGVAGGPLAWANWTFTLDFDEETQSFPTLDGFIEESGIDVEYFEAIDDSASFYATIREQLQQGTHPGYDLFNFADDFTSRLITNGEVQEIDHALIPNIGNMAPLMSNPSYDPGRKFSIPWMGGMTGLCYNTKLSPIEIRSFDDLANPALEGRVSVLTEMLDTVGLTLLAQGVDVSGNWGDDEFQAAIEQIDERLKNGQYAQIKGNSYTQDLESGNVWAAMCWSGDVQVLNDEAGEEIFKFVIPEEGGTKYVNSILVPHGTDRLEDISQLIDYYYRPEVSAKVAEYTYSMPPVLGVQDALAETNPELAESPMLFPSEEDMDRIYDFRDLTMQEMQEYIEDYSRVLGL